MLSVIAKIYFLQKCFLEFWILN